MSDFAKWLSKEIEQHNLGINQLGQYSGVSPSMISNIITGKRHPSPQIVAKLAKYFRVDEDWLLILAGHRTAKTPEADWALVQDPELRGILTAENLNLLPPPTRRAIIAIVKAELAQDTTPNWQTTPVTADANKSYTKPDE